MSTPNENQTNLTGHTSRCPKPCFPLRPIRSRDLQDAQALATRQLDGLPKPNVLTENNCDNVTNQGFVYCEDE